MDFEDMGAGSYGFLAFGVVFLVLGLWFLYRAFQAYKRKTRTKELDGVTKAVWPARLFWGVMLLVIAALMVPAAGDENANLKERLAKEQAATEAREQLHAQIREDLEGQGLTIVSFNPFPSYDSRNFVELQGPMEGCTYKYEVLQNPRGVYVLDRDSGTRHTQDPPMVFPENDGNAYTPECPPGLDLPEGGK